MEQSDTRILEFEKPVFEGKVYRGLSAWEQVQLARHPMRPTSIDYIR